jgi:hypothetical protein
LERRAGKNRERKTGSYKARTNVRLNSDVDICVRLNSTFFPHYPAGKTKEHYGNSDGSVTFDEYRDWVEDALTSHFGKNKIVKGGKAFGIHSSDTRVDADVVPTLAYRYYFGDGSEDYRKPVGVGFNTRDGKRIINWPSQTYENGNAKQDATGERFKKMVRIVKKLRNKMQEEGIAEANEIGSFLIESMVWNVPNEGFNHDDYNDDVRYVLASCFNFTLTEDRSKNLKEVNNIKLLFADSQPWTREQAHKFLSKAWEYIGYK